MLGPYTISPFINNRFLNSACGIGNEDSSNTFHVNTFTSGDPATAGFSIRGAGGARLDSGAPIDTVQLWIDFLRSSVNFKVDVPQLVVTGASQFLSTVTIENMTQINNTLTVESTTLLKDTVQMNGDVSILGTATLYNDLNIFDGIFNMMFGGVNLLTVSTTNSNFYDSNITTTGVVSAGNLTVSSISNVSTLTLSGTTLNINLDGYAISGSYQITINNNVVVLNPTLGITGGVYKLWLTVGATPRIFTKACGVINNLAGDTLMSAGSIWLIEIYKRSAGAYRAILVNLT
jgi:hypothetical protein